MKLASQTMLRLAAVLALSAASASAFAQSADYRRGYDDGFAAGQRAAYENRGDRGDRGDYDRGPEWGRLRIEEAEYGARGSMCDARRAVRDAVERNGGAVRVGNGLCGDPLVGAPKRLNVIYRCGRGEPIQVSARENDTLRLSCPR
jgi:hypothetical protein